MKMVLIVYSEALDEEVMQALRVGAASGYTKWTRVLGDGHSSGPHLGTNIWPKANNVLAVVAEDDQVGPLVECVRALRTELGAEGVKAFVLPVEAVT
jgi:nitrogen regulatory protein PII